MLAKVIARTSEYLKHNSYIYAHEHEFKSNHTQYRMIFGVQDEYARAHVYAGLVIKSLEIRERPIERPIVTNVYLHWPQSASHPARMDLYEFDRQICLAHHVKHYSRERVVLPTTCVTEISKAI